jgi:Asp-tRNA(Asn)/Glu-tRNA(Gln) amidotransferase A subunit family amidase
MPLGWTRDRVGPICRSVGDCALVMNIIARPDGRDLSVSDIPFNWDARLDTRKLRIGYVSEAFADQDRPPDFVRNDRQTLADFQSMGFKLIPIKVPEFPLDILSVPGEAGASFDELIRTSRFRKLTIKNPSKDFRPHRLTTAADYLQAQRARMVMMEKLAAATAGVDVYLAPLPAWGDKQSDNFTQRHYSMGNSAGYPALSIPNGFSADGTPTSINLMARPFGETELLAVAKQYQDSTGFHLKHPPI